MFKCKIAVLLIALPVCGAVSADLSNGLIAHWSFDNCKAVDSSGNRHHGVINGAPKCVAGVIGKALRFNGVSDFVEVPDAQALRLGGTSYTLSGWVLSKSYNPNTESGYQSTLIAKRDTGRQNGYIWSLTGKAAGAPLGRPNLFVSGGLDPWVVSTKGTPLNKWQHIVVTYDFGTQAAAIYTNGVATGAASGFPSPNANTAAALRIARDTNGNNLSPYYLDGILDDLRIYSRVLASDEIAELYNMGQSISGTARGLQQLSVTCTNTTTGQVVTIPIQTGTAWDCEAAGLITRANQEVNISIDGNTYP